MIMVKGRRDTMTIEINSPEVEALIHRASSKAVSKTLRN